MAQSTIGTAPVDPAVVAQAIPFATQVPKSEGGTAQMGTAPRVPREDHQHPRLTATAKGSLSTGTGADAAVEVGTRYVTFTQIYDAEPAVTVLSVGAKTAGLAVPDFDFTFATDANGKFIGGTVYGRRARKLPTQPLAAGPLSALAVLTSVISGLNAIALSITGYDATEPAAGAGFTLIAVKQS